MRHLSRTLTVLVAVAALSAVPLLRAEAIHHPEGCTGPFNFPSPTFPELCDVFPYLCEGTGPVVIMGDTIVDVSKSARTAKTDDWHRETAARRIIRRSEKLMQALQVAPAVATPTLDYIRQNTRPMLDAVVAGQMTVGQLTADIGNRLIQAAETGSTSYQQSSTGGGTVTTTTTGGFEINLGFIKITVGQTVTTVETLPGSGTSDTGYSTECDAEGDCVCVDTVH